MKYIYEVGDIVQLKKKHPCGSTEWQILRVGADFKLKCTGCGHEIMVSRTMVEKNTKNLNDEGKLEKINCLKNYESCYSYYIEKIKN